MAAANSTNAHARLHQPNAPTIPKLRDSCDTCAASKVKCTKEKPICGRCAKRGVACEYFFTRRAGRKHNTRPKDVSGLTMTSTKSSNTSRTGSLTAPPNLNHNSTNSETSGSTNDSLLNVSSSEDLASWWTWTGLASEADDLLVSPTAYLVPERMETENLDDLPFGSDDMNNFNPFGTGAYLMSDDAISMRDVAPFENPNLSTDPSLQPYPPSTMDDNQGSEYRCRCLLRALNLLQRLFRSSSPSSACSAGEGTENTICQLSTIQTIIAESEQVIEAIPSMLQCPCSQDGYLLAIISLILFKILDWYAAASREPPAMDGTQNSIKPTFNEHRNSSCHSEEPLRFPIPLSSYCNDGEDQGRMVAQLVVSELQRLQRLVNGLSERLKRADSPDAVDDGEINRPFSAVVLNQFEKDLHKHLAAVCLEIVLKQ